MAPISKAAGRGPARMTEHAGADELTSPSIDPEEVAKFAAMAADWWNPRGPFRPLHVFNPVRLGFIRETVCAALGRDPAARTPFEGLKLLDVGCGGGLISEPMARLGAEVTGVDASTWARRRRTFGTYLSRASSVVSSGRKSSVGMVVRFSGFGSRACVVHEDRR